MKVIGNIDEVMALNSQLASFIMASCPWVAEDWDPARLGFIYVLDDDDINIVKSVCIVPQELCAGDEDYQSAMTIDLEKFDLWEPPALYDKQSGYWNTVAVFGQEYGCSLLLSSGFVASIPALHGRLQCIQAE